MKRTGTEMSSSQVSTYAEQVTTMKWKQKNYSKAGIIALLTLISAFPPLTTDVYLPALPQLKELLNTTQSMVNLTLSMYFVFFAGGMLFWGPLSEKYGRKTILMIGLVVYTIASFGCAFSQDIVQLIGCRIVQAFAGSSPTVVAAAIVKDLYSGRERERVMALVFSIVVIAPIVAPVLGAILLQYTTWRAMFLLLAAVGITAFIAALFLEETIEERYTGSIAHSWGRLAVVLKNPHFAILLMIFSTVPMGLMTFLAASSFIYIDGFGLSESLYSYFLAFNASFSMIGPALYVRLSNRFQPKNIITVCFFLLIGSGLAVFSYGDLSPYLFALLAGCATIAVVTLRVPATNLMLEQQKKDTGSATALISFFGMLMASVGMYLVTLSPENLIQALGLIQMSIGVVCAGAWLIIRNKPFVRYDFHKS